MVVSVFMPTGFVIARELKATCDFNDPDLPDISASSPYKKPEVKIPVTPKRDYIAGEKPPKGKVAWQKPPRQHEVPARLVDVSAECCTALCSSAVHIAELLW